jgi:hypothetical protein
MHANPSRICRFPRSVQASLAQLFVLSALFLFCFWAVEGLAAPKEKTPKLKVEISADPTYLFQIEGGQNSCIPAFGATFGLIYEVECVPIETAAGAISYTSFDLSGDYTGNNITIILNLIYDYPNVSVGPISCVLEAGTDNCADESGDYYFAARRTRKGITGVAEVRGPFYEYPGHYAVAISIGGTSPGVAFSVQH